MLLKDGNLTGIAIASVFVAELVLVFVAIYWLESYLGRLISFSVGLSLCAAVRYAGRAKAIGFRHFDEAEWCKAKRTYDDWDDSRDA